MKIFDTIFSQVIIFVEVLCALLFADSFCHKLKRLKAVQVIFIFIGTWAVASGIASLLQDRFLIKQIILVLVYAVVIWEFFNKSLISSFIIPFIGQVILLLPEYLVSRLFFTNSSLNFINFSDFNIYSILLLTIARIFTISLVAIFHNKSGNSDVLKNKDLVLFTVIPVISFIILTLIILNWDLGYNDVQEKILAWISLGLLLMNIMVFYLIISIINRERTIKDYEIFTESIRNDLHTYDMVSENYKEQRKKTHEYINTMECISGLVRDGQYDKLRNYLNVIKDDIDDSVNYLECGNAIVNAIINTKLTETRKKGIAFYPAIDNLSELQLNDSDVVMTLSNMLNNAIEACEKCETPYIHLKIRIENGEVIVSVINAMKERPEYNGKHFFTTKRHKSIEHGFGITNILAVVKKYEGTHSIDHTSNEFRFTIIVPKENLCK